MANLVLNRIQTPDGTVLTSYHRYDFIVHHDANGLKYFVDGGLEYTRRAIHIDYPYHELSVYDNEDFSIVREAFHCAIPDKQGCLVLSSKWLPLSQLENACIKKIINSQKYLPDYWRILFEKELAYRME
ncbi:hypothetical protein GL272_10180 [Aeromonas veronii]|uniref:hypothetical protein n=1 Tax=Aeromonas veronii TaxID=654 RepID=UPI001302170E|nr:hypothetical protein [Aeromonas veronii]KAE9625338.1 hypothetical protein GO627_08105 [Aeromonas veronii]MBW3777295.1 hypothetical protein [Aeromonas veronii]